MANSEHEVTMNFPQLSAESRSISGDDQHYTMLVMYVSTKKLDQEDLKEWSREDSREFWKVFKNKNNKPSSEDLDRVKKFVQTHATRIVEDGKRALTLLQAPQNIIYAQQLRVYAQILKRYKNDLEWSENQFMPKNSQAKKTCYRELEAATGEKSCNFVKKIVHNKRFILQLLGDINYPIRPQYNSHGELASSMKLNARNEGDGGVDDGDNVAEDGDSRGQSSKTERDELQQENNNNNKGTILVDEKRRLEARIATLEEEQSKNEVRARKAQVSIEQMAIDLQTERSHRSLLEQQNAELKAKLAERETVQRAKSKPTLQEVQSKMDNRLLQKKVKKLESQVEDERQNAEQYKEQVERVNNKMKSLKKQLDEAEEEIYSLKACKSKQQREIEDMMESKEVLTSELAVLKNQLRRGGQPMGGLASARLKRTWMQTSGSGEDSATQDESIDGEEIAN